MHRFSFPSRPATGIQKHSALGEGDCMQLIWLMPFDKNIPFWAGVFSGYKSSTQQGSSNRVNSGLSRNYRHCIPILPDGLHIWQPNTSHLKAHNYRWAMCSPVAEGYPWNIIQTGIWSTIRKLCMHTYTLCRSFPSMSTPLSTSMQNGTKVLLLGDRGPPTKLGVSW